MLSVSRRLQENFQASFIIRNLNLIHICTFLFLFLGLAAEDCAVAKMVYDRYTMEEERNQQ